ncbi:acyloxyacyl hydrolase [Flavobacterium luteum]|uniref:Acyloxyacyl hydrolase n=1 Tax=Flavobacterium luteum TaxID=2026654 RepID=A0A7J5A8D2_9FLAO|nr:acyloxyacyl hydrolase [Flavobacterium luteum]KAB1153767.1 acyloxyacyl hydrolase [Flavobacterium luteum]
MKLFILLPIILFTNLTFSQEFENSYTIDLNYFRGNVMAHSPDLYQLITGHPDGLMLNFSRKTSGKEEWNSLYNFPDYGGYFLYQDYKNELLGQNFAVGAFYNFYFLNRKLSFKIAQGIGITTNPYDKETNSKNKALGSKVMGNINLGLYYKKENVIDNFGFQAGFLFTHFSNGRIKSPNSGINTYCLNMGVNYVFDEINRVKPDSIRVKLKFTEPIKYNVLFRTGFNESPVVGSGQKPFYHIGFYADKRINRKSAIQVGTELFLTTSIKEYIRFRSISFPEYQVNSSTDFKRVGVFVGHELFVNKISLEGQIGYYIYRPFKDGAPIYDRVGMKYYFSKKVFTGVSLVTHGFLAEAMEFVIGVRL